MDLRENMKEDFYLLLRKFRSLISRFSYLSSTFSTYIGAVGNSAVVIKEHCRFGRAVKLVATDGGSLSIGKRAFLSDYVQIVVEGGRVTIEDDVFIGTGSIIVCRENVFIGKDSLIAEYVVIRDQSHRICSRPIKSAGFDTSPVHIGQDVWIGCKATVLRGAFVGNGCVIGAHALVNSKISDNMLAIGTPARAVRHTRGGQ